MDRALERVARATSSKASSGTTKNVATLHAAPTSEMMIVPMSWVTALPLSTAACSALRMSPTVACTSAQRAIRPRRRRAAASPPATVASPPSMTVTVEAASATPA